MAKPVVHCWFADEVKAGFEAHFVESYNQVFELAFRYDEESAAAAAQMAVSL